VAEAPIYDTIAVIGCGLIGGSLVRAARKTGAAGRIVVCEQGAALERVRELGIADAVTDKVEDAIKGADLVVYAIPVQAIIAVSKLAGFLYEPGQTVTDVGSVKGVVGQALRESAQALAHVIPGHPIAGTEHSGPDAGFPELFENRWTILTPANDPSPDYQRAVERLTAFWTRLGAKVDTMDEQHHDLVLAVTSHLPHLIAYNIVGTADDLEKVTQGEVIKYSAGGFRDFTRIAASDPVMWRDVFLTNTKAVLEVLERFQTDLGRLTEAMKKGDGETLQAWFTHTRAIRRGIIEAGQETAEPDFGRTHGHAPVSTDEPSQ
jgi:cyclohexadieny/prephenate dehydrogenase